jgi:hypothetical protein
MKIIRADNGASIDVNFPSNATVDHVKQKVYENYSIPVDQQILLCEGTKLPAQKTFAELGLTQVSSCVAIFSKIRSINIFIISLG